MIHLGLFIWAVFTGHPVVAVFVMLAMLTHD